MHNDGWMEGWMDRWRERERKRWVDGVGLGSKRVS